MDCFSPQILVFLKGFKDDEQKKLAIELGIILANGFCKAQVLTSVFEEHLVKEGKNSSSRNSFKGITIISFKTNLLYYM